MKNSFLLQACAAATTLPLALSGCGARTPLSIEGFSDPGPTAPAATVPAAMDGGRPDDDPCPFAVLPGAPKPMAGNCSTRDGRARVPAPRAPHVTWTLPKLPLAMQIGATLATDASDHAYLLSEDVKSFQLTLRRIDTARGVLEWSSPFAPAVESLPTPFLPRSRPPSVISEMPAQIVTFALATGAPSATATPGLVFGFLRPDPAVGADGSLYLLTHMNGDGSSGAPFAATRIAPDGTTMWRSIELTGVATPVLPGSKVEGFPNGVALGADGTVFVEFNGLATPYAQYTVVVALDPSGGGVLWQQTLAGQALGGLVVAPDGSIAVVAYASPQQTDVIVLEKTGTVRRRVAVPMSNRLCGAARDGTLLVYLELGGGESGLAAIDPSGKLAWQKAEGFLQDAFLASDGAIVAYGTDVRGIDLATGGMRWSLTPPNQGFPAGVCDAALTRSGSIVALGCDGSLFGASD